MGIIVLVIAAVVIFSIGVVSPHKAGKIQRKTDKQAAWLKRWADWMWDPIAWWTKKSIEFTRKSLNRIADWGKKANKKTPPK